MPICFICGTADGVVRTDYIEKFANKTQNSDNELHWIDKADHTDIVFNGLYCS